MKKPLSISSYSLYMECPAKYEIQKIQRLQPVHTMSYFIFGSAVDKALNALLLNEGDPYEIADLELDRIMNEEVDFLPNDYDGEIIPDEEKKLLLTVCKTIGYKGEDIDSLASTLLGKPYKERSVGQKTALARLVVESLRVKARLMIDAYKRKVLPMIDKIESVQNELKWTDEKGQEFIGIPDKRVTLRGYGSLIGDNKTSSNPQRDYDQNSVKRSMQLSIYTKIEGVDKAAYFALGKNLKKNRVKTCSECGNDGTGKRHKTCDAILDDGLRCDGEWNETIKPEVEVHIVIDKINPEEQAISQRALSNVAESIAKGCFPQNLKACVQKFGPKESVCPYYNYCRNGSREGLVKKEDK